MPNNHKMFNASGDGEKWKQCKVCGCSYHSNLWWLAGYKSEIEPPCCTNFDGFREWSASAVIFDDI